MTEDYEAGTEPASMTPEEEELYDEAMKAAHGVRDTEAAQDDVGVPDIPTAGETPEMALGAGSEAPVHSGALALYDQMKRTWGLKGDDLIALINPPAKRPLTPAMVAHVRAYSMQYGIPIPGFNFIDTTSGIGYNLYINAAGMQFRLATDPRGIQSIEPHIDHMPDFAPAGEERAKDYIQITTTITMKDGSHATDFGISEWPVLKGRNMGMALGDLVMKLVTKSIRRCTTRLVGTTLPVYDADYHSFINEGRKDGTIEGDFRVITPPEKPPKDNPDNLAELMEFAKERYDLGVDDVVELSGEPDFNTNIDFRATWEAIKEKYGKSKSPDEE